MAASNCGAITGQKRDCNEQQPVRDLDLETSKSDKERGFLDLALEIRLMVYELFFGAQVYRIRQPGRATEDVVIATARQKVPLLLANRAVWAEASPVFYRLHIFRIRLLYTRQFPILTHNCLSAGIQNVLQAIQYVDLTYENPDLDTSTDWNVADYLRFLRLGCPALKSLRIELVKFSRTDWVRELAPELRLLWTRLDSLELCLEHWDELDAMPQGDFIAPAEEWHRKKCESPPVDAAHRRLRRGMWRTTYCVERHQKADQMG